MNRLLFFCSLLASSMAMVAQPRSYFQAMEEARDFFSEKRGHPIVCCSPDLESSSNEGAFQPYYVFQDSMSRRRVFISGDARMVTILGYSDNAVNEEEPIPKALQELLDLYKREYDYLMALSDDDTEISPSFIMSAPNVEPMIKTRWGQGSPYNDKSPNGSASGCVATAMAQIMTYHRHPERGVNVYSYISRTRGFQLTCDFRATAFDWFNLRESYNSSATIAQRQAVSTLMYACGVAVSMDYGLDRSGQSGAYDFDVPYALVHYLGYGSNIVNLHRDYYSNDEWYERLYQELQEGRPVLYCGADSRSGGHAFVIDGCRSSDNLVHVNWGWDGSFDGYFALNSLNPDHYRFATNQSMVAQISPQLVGMNEDVFYAEKFILNGTLKDGASLKATMTELWCNASTASYSDISGRFSGVVGIGVFDQDLHFVKSLTETNHNDAPIGTVKTKWEASFSINGMMLEDGSYYIAPYAMSMDAEQPTRVRTLGGKYDIVGFEVIDGQINGEEDDAGLEDEPDVGDILWREDFEQDRFPEDMSQHSIQGSGTWEVQKILLSTSEKAPSPFHGNGYALLKSMATDLNGSRDVCQLMTGIIQVPRESKNELILHIRKYTRRQNTNDALNILLYMPNEGWTMFHETSVTTTSSWETVAIDLPEGLTSFRVGFEGCVGQGAILFLDDIIVSRKISDRIWKMPATTHSDLIYSPSGISTSHLSHGLNIIHLPNGTIRKVFVKKP